jgi:adenosylhomocysteine nucleosidase
MPPRVAIVAALVREIAPLAKSFARVTAGENALAAYRKTDVMLVSSGIGGRHAAAATRWAIASLKPDVVMSVGFAGALVPDGKVGDVITPGTVIDGATGHSFSVATGKGVLVSVASVLNERGKRELAVRYGAQAVDMESAAVAQVAGENGIPFFAVKSLSDEVSFRMPPMERFVDEAGKFRNSRLLAYAAVRPALWPVLVRLGANAKKASSQLCEWLENQMSRDFQDILQGAGKPALS